MIQHNVYLHDGKERRAARARDRYDQTLAAHREWSQAEGQDDRPEPPIPFIFSIEEVEADPVVRRAFVDTVALIGSLSIGFHKIGAYPVAEEAEQEAIRMRNAAYADLRERTSDGES